MTLATYDDGDPDGAPVVLLHAGIADARMWAPQVAPLAGAGHRVVRTDLPGFGETPQPVADYDPAVLVRAALDERGVGPAVVVGASFGGFVAQRLAVLAPERVRAVALVCAAFSDAPPQVPELAELDRREEELLAAGDIAGAVEVNVRGWLGPDADAAARERLSTMLDHAFRVQDGAGPGVWAELRDVDVAELTVPALVVSGGHDFANITAAAGANAARMPRARHVHLPWAGHLPSMERPEEFTALLLEFLAEVDAAP